MPCRLELEQPLLLPEELAQLEAMSYRGWHTAVLDATWPAAEGPQGLQAALERIADDASRAIDAGYQFLVLSDRAAGTPPLHHQLCHVGSFRSAHPGSGPRYCRSLHSYWRQAPP